MKILITGDFCPINRFLSAQNDLSFIDEVNSLTKGIDLVITNLECPITESIKPIAKTGPALRTSAKAVKFLKDTGFNLVTLANNHIMDYGAAGLNDTLDELIKNGIQFVGAGSNNEKKQIIYHETNGVKLAIINFCENEWSTRDYNGFSANGFSEIDAFYSIQKAKENADKVVVIHHGGHEMYQLPSLRLKKTFRFFVDSGADAVFNHHTHCISGYEVYKGSPIFYSLGNFLFDNPNLFNSIWNYGLAVQLKIEKESINFEIINFEQFNGETFFKIQNSIEINNEIDSLNKVIQSDKELDKQFEIFFEKKRKLYKSYLEPTKSRFLLALINRKLIPSFWQKRKKYYLKNLISCESHREIVEKILNEEISNTPK